MNWFWRVFVAVFVLSLGLGGLPSNVDAGKYPEKTITYVVPFGAGGGTDRWARILSSAAIDHFGQAWHVVNLPGASAVVGWKHVLGQPADGYTILQGSSTPMLALIMEEKPALNPDEIKIVAFVSSFRSVLLSQPGKPWSTWEGLKAYAKKNPGKLTVGGTLSLSMGQAFVFQQAGIKATYVPYPSTSKAVADFIGGHIDTAAVTTSTAIPLIPKRAIPVINTSEIPIKHKAFKGVPSATDLGYEGMSFPRWVGVHPNTPDEIADVISAKLTSLVKDKSVTKLIDKVGEEIIFLPRAQAVKEYDKVIARMKKAAPLLK